MKSKFIDFLDGAFLLSMVAESIEDKKGLQKIRQGLQGINHSAGVIAVGEKHYKYWVSHWVEISIGFLKKGTERMEMNFIPWTHDDTLDELGNHLKLENVMIYNRVRTQKEIEAEYEMVNSMIRHDNLRRARFKPVKLETLRPELKDRIGEILWVNRGFVADKDYCDGSYDGQTVWSPFQAYVSRFYGYSIPDEDLEFLAWEDIA